MMVPGLCTKAAWAQQIPSIKTIDNRTMEPFTPEKDRCSTREAKVRGEHVHAYMIRRPCAYSYSLSTSSSNRSLFDFRIVVIGSVRRLLKVGTLLVDGLFF